MLSQGLILPAHLLNVCFQNELTSVAVEVFIPLDQLTAKPIITTKLKKQWVLFYELNLFYAFQSATRSKQTAINIVLWYHTRSTLHNKTLFILTVHYRPLLRSSRSARRRLAAESNMLLVCDNHHQTKLCFPPHSPTKKSSNQGKFSGTQNYTAISAKICN